jgi:SAM-dependent methyltransferase
LLREARQLARQEGFGDVIEFHEGRAEALPFSDDSIDVALSRTVMEEGDADRMLAELIRLTKPGGRVAVMVRAVDVPAWVNLPLNPELKAKVSRPGLFRGRRGPRRLCRCQPLSSFLQGGSHAAALFPAVQRRDAGRTEVADASAAGACRLQR